MTLELNQIQLARFTPQSCVSIFKVLKHNQSLKKLYMSDSTIDQAASEALADMLSHNSTLTKLNVSRCSLTSQSCVSIFNALKHNSSLKKLISTKVDHQMKIFDKAASDLLSCNHSVELHIDGHVYQPKALADNDEETSDDEDSASKSSGNDANEQFYYSKLKHFLTFAEPEDEIFDQVAKEILEKSGVDTSLLSKSSYAGYLNSWPTVSMEFYHSYPYCQHQHCVQLKTSLSPNHHYCRHNKEEFYHPCPYSQHQHCAQLKTSPSNFQLQLPL